MDAFWDKAIRRDNGCIEWAGSVDRDGYGVFRRKRAHRVAYAVTYGVEPGTQHVLHSCDNPGCVNPEHLRLGTHTENMADAVKRGRFRHRGRPLAADHCVNGHDYDEANTYWRPSGQRDCRTCIRARTRAYKARRAA